MDDVITIKHKNKDIEIYENPTANDIRALFKESGNMGVRIIKTSDKIYAWNIMKNMIHVQARDHLRLPLASGHNDLDVVIESIKAYQNQEDNTSNFYDEKQFKYNYNGIPCAIQAAFYTNNNYNVVSYEKLPPEIKKLIPVRLIPQVDEEKPKNLENMIEADIKRLVGLFKLNEFTYLR